MKKSLALLIYIALASQTVFAAKNPIEVGNVTWSQDYEASLKLSEASGKPVFLLFQEVPGCAGCQQFGREVLSNPLLVEAIEDLFLPVLAYNNRSGGKDDALRKHFKEPAWNYQVIRFIDGQGKDIIPRRDRIWTLGGVTSRMILALEKAKRPVPQYLVALAAEHNTANQGETAFSMYCFWTGEVAIGKLDGVISTEAGFLDGHEVTRVKYDKNKISLQDLAEKASHARCASKVYKSENDSAMVKGFPLGILDSTYRSSRSSDQKKQIERWAAIHKVPGLTAMQKTKINALARTDKTEALAWLSPRQLAVLNQYEKGL